MKMSLSVSQWRTLRQLLDGPKRFGEVREMTRHDESMFLKLKEMGLIEFPADGSLKELNPVVKITQLGKDVSHLGIVEIQWETKEVQAVPEYKRKASKQ